MQGYSLEILLMECAELSLLVERVNFGNHLKQGFSTWGVVDFQGRCQCIIKEQENIIAC